MIARVWTGATTPANADAYVNHLRDNIFPELKHLPGHRAAYVLRRLAGATVAFTVVTLWESLDAIRAFAGADLEAAVVPAEAQALLDSYDRRAVHWDVPLSST
jgi:heme-degrading monooxygenase HmoA